MSRKRPHNNNNTSASRPTRRQRTITSDNDDEDEDNDSELDERGNFIEAPMSTSEAHDILENPLTEDMLRNQRRNDDRTKYATSGIIKTMLLENFMCHRKFRFEAGPNINFIYGQNGSGKSALLAALQTVFMARASDTGRGSNINDLIMEGHSWGRITVEIANEGTDAYRVDELGPHFTLIRDLSASGGGYRFLNSHGKLMSRKEWGSKRVREMCSHFMIQVHNPVVVMDQDRAKQFLGNEATKKYEFFMKGSGLDDMQSKLVEARSTLQDTSIYIAHLGSTLPQLERDAKAAEREWEHVQHVRDEEKQLLLVKKKLLWAHVRDEEDKLKTMEKQLASISTDITKHEQLIASASLSESEFTSTSDTLTTELGTLAQDVITANDAVKEAEERIKLNKSVMIRNESTLTSRRTAKKATERQKLMIEKKMETIRTAAEHDYAAEESQRQSQLLQAQMEKQKILDQLKEKESGIKEMEETLADLTSRLRSLTEEESNQVHHQSRCESKIRELEGRVRNKATAFGQKVVQVAEAIASTSWTHRPIGPLGSLMSVPDPIDATWLWPIEQALSTRLLRAYVVDNHRDREKLTAILKKYYAADRMPTIIVQKMSHIKHNIKESTIPETTGMRRVSDTIQIENAWAYNVMIDQTHCEFSYLHGDQKEAFHHCQRYGREIQAIFLKNGSKVFYRGSSTALQRSKEGGTPLLAVDVGTELDRIRQEMETKMHELREIRDKKISVKEQEKEVRQSFTCHSRSLEPFRRSLRTIDNRISDLSITRDTPDHSGEMMELENQKQNMEREQVEIEAKIQELEQQREKLVQRDTELRTHMDTLIETKLQAQSIHDEKQKELEKFISEYGKKRSKLAKYSQQLTSLQEQHTSKQRDIERQSKLVQSKIDELMDAHGERMEVNEPTARLATAAHTLQTRYDAKIRGMTRKPDDIFTDYKRKQELYAKKKEEYDMQAQVKAEQDRQYKQREQDWARLRRTVANSLNLAFTQNMLHQNRNGELKFNHTERTLDIHVSVRDDIASQGIPTSTSNLSGGEKSFSTISFLLALGEQMDCPFRAMDEFDVFMDPVNRHNSMNLLITICRKIKNRQFFFLTPQDITDIKPDRDINLVKMPPPRRRDDPLQQQLHEMS